MAPTSAPRPSDRPEPRPGDTSTGATRVEHDSMGEVLVPVSARWGAQTQRAVQNFPVSGRPIAPRLIRALGLIKAEAARANAGVVDAVDVEVGAAIAAAADEVAAGQHDHEFPVDVYQTGSGTSSNMNANEVIAHLASEHLGRPIHPNDQVNAGQSSNDVFPTAIHLAALEGLITDLLPALDHLAIALRGKAIEFTAVVKSGRTHLMDAVPVTLGQELGAHATQVERAGIRLRATIPHLSELPIGGTAVGTGINTPAGFGAAVAGRLAARLSLPLVETPDHVAAQSAPEAFVELSGQLRAAAVGLIKIANDLRWMASGPRTGLAEIHLPDLQPGSSIMPGKVNPVLCEAVTQVGAQVIGNDATVGFALSQGNFELNVYLPVVAHDLLESIQLLTNVSVLFADRCVAGIVADAERCRTYAESSPAVATSLNPYLGYDRTAALIKESQRTGTPIRELVAALGELSDEELDAALDVSALAHPHG